MAKKEESKETYLFQWYEKDNSQIQTKEGATGYALVNELLPKCVAIYKNDAGALEPQTLRYIEGETDLRITKQRKEITRGEERPLLFKDGHMVISRFEPLKLEFMLNHPQYEGNPNRDTRKPILFKIVNKEEVKIKELNKEKVKIEADALVLDMFKNDFKGAKLFCEAVGVNTNQEADLMEHDLLIKVRRNPALFIKQLQDPTMKQKAFVRNAIKEGVISIKANAVTWGDGSPTGFTCPIGSETEDEFIAWFEDKTGKKVYDQIKFRLNNPIEALR